MMDLTLYEILGVPHNASLKDLKEAYHAKLLDTHPDKADRNKSGSASDTPVTVSDLKHAHTILSNEDSRRAYDEELSVLFKKQGFNITGEGLDAYTLSDFSESYDPKSDSYSWSRSCPRCTTPNAMVLNEPDLERGTPDAAGLLIVVPCQTCSLWITVLYEEL